MGMDKLIDLDRLSLYHDLLKELAAYSLSNSGFTVRLTGGLGDSAVQLPIFAKTTAEWNADPDIVSQPNTLYIYTDYRTDDNGNPVPGFKIGNGNAYLIDLAFHDYDILQHISNTNIHVTAAEKTFWNNKVTSFIDDVDDEQLVLTKN